MKKKFVIIGGGTAGWLSALYVNKLYGTDADITLIESDEQQVGLTKWKTNFKSTT